MSAPLNPELTRRIESTLIAPVVSRRQIEELCAIARADNYFAVCMSGSRVELARTLLDDIAVQVVALTGPPSGDSDADVKRYEVEVAADQGAHEIDYVIDIGRLRDGDHKYILRELRDAVEAADERSVKAVIEKQWLTAEETILACKLANDSGVRFVSTSVHSLTTSVEDVKSLRENLDETIGIKVLVKAGDEQTALHFIEAGAARVGWIMGPS